MSRDAPMLLHEFFAAVAHRHADRVAVEIPPSDAQPRRICVTYGQLQQQADAISAALRPLTYRDALVSVLLPRSSVGLYAAQLGVLQAGAAFACVDPAFPDGLLRAVLEDAGAVALLTDAVGCERIRAWGASAPLAIDVNRLRVPVNYAAGIADPRSLAYVIYTSGTTGQPKGVLIEHRSIVNLVRSNLDYFDVSCEDRVGQCSSPAYDASIEETWLAFAAGATLVPMDEDVVRLGPDLVPWLRGERISVLSPPPTLLRTTGCVEPRRELPDLRLLYVGGEALTADLAAQWAPGRRLENAYGPTECTVTVVRGRVRPGEPVMIGTPVVGNRGWVLDEAQRPVPDGEPGELCIGGISLARGYHRREQLTHQRFPQHPQFGRLYRTGDLVRRAASGELEYLGRIDSQVKLRGYRIELGAVEAHLTQCTGVRAAACRVQGVDGDQVLIAHIVPESPADPPTAEALKESLRRTLPAYMVPSRFALADGLPTQVSGKLDRQALPDIDSPHNERSRPHIAPRNAQELTVANAFASALGIAPDFSVEDDFFLELGGDSLAAVGAICELRRLDDGSSATVRDLYETRTAAALAERLDRRHTRPIRQPRRRASHRPRVRPVWATAVQGIWLACELVATSAVLYLLTFGALPSLVSGIGAVPAILLAPLFGVLGLIVYAPTSILITLLVKKLLIGRYRSARVPVWSAFFTRHWMVANAAQWIPWWLLEGTVFLPAALRLLGARVGRRVTIHRNVDLRHGGWDLITIGDDVTLAQDAAIRVAEFDDGQLVLGPINVGAGATIDVRGGMSPHSTIERDGYLTALSWLPRGARIPAGQRWDGVPARHVGEAPPRPGPVRGREFAPTTHGLLMLVGRCARILATAAPTAALAAAATLALPDATGRILQWLENPSLSTSGILLFLAVSVSGLPLGLLCQALMLRAMGRAQCGVWSQWSLEAIRIWIKTGVVDSASRWLSGAIFWPWWLRAAGMRIGRCCEISTITDVVPETVAIGEESFFADGIYFCGPWRHRGTVTVAENSLRRNTFLGNHSVIPIGGHWPDDYFVGVSTVADEAQARPHSAWFGHPPMELPRRQVVASDRRLTHEPGLVRYTTRLFWEALRFLLPVFPVLVGIGWYRLLESAAHRVGIAGMVLGVVPALTLGAAASICLAVVVLKWLLLGRVRPGHHAFWSCWCARWDFLYVTWSNWATRPLRLLEGTLFLNAFLRLTGVRIGRRVVLNYGFAQVVDPDMLAFEDDATVNCHFQAHSFEDRILKIDRIRIGQGATVGAHAVVFYGADIGDGAWVSPHSVVMKCDLLEPQGRYAGCPTRPESATAPARRSESQCTLACR